MKPHPPVVLFYTLLTLLSLFTHTTFSAIVINGCDTYTQNGDYVLNTFINWDVHQYCIIFTAQNVNFNGNGNSITCTDCADSLTRFSIYFQSPSADSTAIVTNIDFFGGGISTSISTPTSIIVENCNFNGGSYGVKTGSVTEAIINDNTFVGLTAWSVYITNQDIIGKAVNITNNDFTTTTGVSIAVNSVSRFCNIIGNNVIGARPIFGAMELNIFEGRCQYGGLFADNKILNARGYRKGFHFDQAGGSIVVQNNEFSDYGANFNMNFFNFEMINSSNTTPNLKFVGNKIMRVRTEFDILEGITIKCVGNSQATPLISDNQIQDVDTVTATCLNKFRGIQLFDCQKALMLNNTIDDINLRGDCDISTNVSYVAVSLSNNADLNITGLTIQNMEVTGPVSFSGPVSIAGVVFGRISGSAVSFYDININNIKVGTKAASTTMTNNDGISVIGMFVSRTDHHIVSSTLKFKQIRIYDLYGGNGGDITSVSEGLSSQGGRVIGLMSDPNFAGGDIPGNVFNSIEFSDVIMTNFVAGQGGTINSVAPGCSQQGRIFSFRFRTFVLPSPPGVTDNLVYTCIPDSIPITSCGVFSEYVNMTYSLMNDIITSDLFCLDFHGVSHNIRINGNFHKISSNTTILRMEYAFWQRTYIEDINLIGTLVSILVSSAVSVEVKNTNFLGGESGLWWSVQDYAQVSNCTFTGFTARSVLLAGNARLLVENSVFSDTQSLGLQGSQSNATVRNCTFKGIPPNPDNRNGRYMMYSGSRITFQNNIIHNVTKLETVVWLTAAIHIIMDGNIIKNSENQVLFLVYGQVNTQIYFINNEFYNIRQTVASKYYVTITSQAAENPITATISNNIMDGVYLVDKHCINTDPIIMLLLLQISGILNVLMENNIVTNIYVSAPYCFYEGPSQSQYFAILFTNCGTLKVNNFIASNFRIDPAHLMAGISSIAGLGIQSQSGDVYINNATFTNITATQPVDCYETGDYICTNNKINSGNFYNNGPNVAGIFIFSPTNTYISNSKFYNIHGGDGGRMYTESTGSTVIESQTSATGGDAWAIQSYATPLNTFNFTNVEVWDIRGGKPGYLNDVQYGCANYGKQYIVDAITDLPFPAGITAYGFGINPCIPCEVAFGKAPYFVTPQINITQLIQECAKSGDTVNLGPGNYDLNLGLIVQNEIKIIGNIANPSTVVLTGSTSIEISSAVEISGVTITNFNNIAISITLTADTQIVTISDCVFSNNNQAILHRTTTGQLKIYNSKFKNNTATNSGAGIYSNTKNIEIYHSIFSNNTATVAGGGIYLHNSGNLYNCIIENNSANKGGGIFVENGAPILNNCTFNSNNVKLL